jgi:hypothetical protein
MYSKPPKTFNFFVKNDSLFQKKKLKKKKKTLIGHFSFFHTLMNKLIVDDKNMWMNYVIHGDFGKDEFCIPQWVYMPYHIYRLVKSTFKL